MKYHWLFCDQNYSRDSTLSTRKSDELDKGVLKQPKIYNEYTFLIVFFYYKKTIYAQQIIYLKLIH